MKKLCKKKERTRKARVQSKARLHFDNYNRKLKDFTYKLTPLIMFSTSHTRNTHLEILLLFSRGLEGSWSTILPSSFLAVRLIAASFWRWLWLFLLLYDYNI